MRIIAVINQKGGVGKSTSTQAIGAGLRKRGKRVLFVDLDAQGNLSYGLGAEGGARGNVLDVLENRRGVLEAVQETAQGDVIGSSPGLAGADTVLTALGKEHRLRKALEGVKGRYDFVLIDTPPALGVLTINALTACDGCLIPSQADVYSLQGIDQLFRTVETVREYCNPGLKVNGILLTRYNARAVISRELSEMIGQLAERMQTKLYGSRIRECTALKEAQAMRKDIFEYAPKSNAALDYEALVEEILEEADGRE